MKINTISNPKAQEHRKVTDSFYTSKKHKTLREQAFIRDKGECVKCHRPLNLHTTRETKEYMAFGDHIKPREAGGKDEISNYQTMCKPCHDSKSNEDKQYYK